MGVQRLEMVDYAKNKMTEMVMDRLVRDRPHPGYQWVLLPRRRATVHFLLLLCFREVSQKKSDHSEPDCGFRVR